MRFALALVDGWTRRRVLLSAVLAVALAALEVAAFSLLYLLVNLLRGGGPPELGARALAGIGVSGEAEVLRVVAVLAVCMLLTRSAGAIVMSRWQTRFQNMAESRLATGLFRDYLDQDFLFHADRNSSTLIRNLTGSIGIVTNSVIGAVVSLTTDGLVLLGTLIVIGVVAPALAVAIAVFGGVVVGGYLLFLGPMSHRAATQDQHLTAETIRALQEGFSGVKSVHVYNVIDAVHARYTEQRQQLAASRATLAFVQRLPQYYLEVCLVAGAAAASVVMVRVSGREEAFAALGLLVLAALRVLPSVGRILGSLAAIRNGEPAVRLLKEEQLAATPVAVSSPRLPDDPPKPGSLVLSGVSFRYPSSAEEVLQDVTLEIPFGSFLGVVGPSGSGKTTLVDLILGLMQPTRGHVAVDGIPMTRATHAEWRGRVGYVPQDTYLFDATLRENVLFYRQIDESVRDDRVWEAIAAAQLADTVRALPEGLDTLIGERGVRLSGGQKQRLGIARALLGRPSVLVLDEATSALDGATEAAVSATIEGLRGKLTLIVVAHRLSTLTKCDSLVLLEAGSIAAVGTLQDLARASATFAESFEHAALTGREE